MYGPEPYIDIQYSSIENTSKGWIKNKKRKLEKKKTRVSYNIPCKHN